MKELLEALNGLFPSLHSFELGKEREIIIEVSEDEMNNHNPISKYALEQTHSAYTIDNPDLKNAFFTSLISPLGFKITLKIKE